MPLYEYRCEACGARFASLQPMGASRTGAECPKCKGKSTRRILSTFATRPAPASGSAAPAVPSCAPGGT